MKPVFLLSLLAVALVANAQSVPGVSDSAGASASAGASVPPSDPAAGQPSPSIPDPNGGQSSATPTPSDTAPPPSDTAKPPDISTPPPQPSPSLTVSQQLSVNPDGDTVTVESTITLPPTTTPSTSPSPSSSSPPSSGGGGITTGGIIGLSVAGGVALICLIAFFVWKFTRKRMRDFDDSENIKWPELNAHGGNGADSHAMPVHNTGRAGFTDDDMSRAPSVANTYAASSTDFHSEGDPYAVPPLPHMNPGQPYRDDPGAPGTYYDPYHGPVPQTFNEAHGAPPAEWGQNEAIPMTQMAQRTGSPAPMMYDAGRASPGPQMAYGPGPGRTPSPGPQMAYGGGRTPSPGPQAAYGGGYGAGRASPGPQAAYNAGRASPGPQGAYGGGP